MSREDDKIYKRKVRKRDKRRLTSQMKKKENLKIENITRKMALRNVFQFEDYPINNLSLQKSVDAVINDISNDLEKHTYLLDPKTYLQCSSCGIKKLPE